MILSHKNIQTKRRTERQTDRETDRQTDRVNCVIRPPDHINKTHVD